ncbi:MAG: MucB/RseB C-terminal domain-containing protein [Gammaproteobacteria bacterium]|nr:MucB/RseB C-terminal domain-containing protein [Gammaproteobacteria bacterium]
MPSRLLLFTFFYLPALVLATELVEVQKLLKKMQHAAHMQNYDGTFVYSEGESKLSAMRLIHSADQKGERERLVSLDNVGREVIRNSKNVICILPDRNAVVVEKGRPPAQFPPQFPDKLDHLKDHYSFKIEGEEKVAGQLAHKLVVLPNDNFRYGHHLWIDKKTGLLLKTHLVNEKGSLVEQFMFTHIKYMKRVPEKLLQSSVDSTKFKRYESNDLKPKSKPVSPSLLWKVTQLPPGFKRDHHRQLKIPTSRTPSNQLVFTDGLASISVFIENNMEDPNLVGRTNMGAVNAHGKTFKDYHVTAVGEVPHASVKMISESVVLNSR